VREGESDNDEDDGDDGIKKKNDSNDEDDGGDGIEQTGEGPFLASIEIKPIWHYHCVIQCFRHFRWGKRSTG
jgi:hypothetical protein